MRECVLGWDENMVMVTGPECTVCEATEFDSCPCICHEWNQEDEQALPCQPCVNGIHCKGRQLHMLGSDLFSYQECGCTCVAENTPLARMLRGEDISDD